MTVKTPSAYAEEIGMRLKQARLNRDLTQADVARLAGVARKTVINAEKGKAQLEVLIAILMALDLTSQLELFIPLRKYRQCNWQNCRVKNGSGPLVSAQTQTRSRQRGNGSR